MDEVRPEQVSDEDRDVPIGVTLLVSHRTLRGLVRLVIDGRETQLPATKAREIGAWLQEAAAAAELDSFMISFLMRRVGLELPQAGQILREFREWREERGLLDETATNGPGPQLGE